MPKSAPIQIVLHAPTQKHEQQQLAQRISDLHLGFVSDTLKQLNCPLEQKQQLLQAVIDSVCTSLACTCTVTRYPDLPDLPVDIPPCAAAEI